MSTPTPYDHTALWIKAKLFLNHAMDEDEPRSFDERALWATLALELLAKAALARVSPLLIAEPSEEGTNLLMASGLLIGNKATGPNSGSHLGGELQRWRSTRLPLVQKPSFSLVIDGDVRFSSVRAQTIYSRCHKAFKPFNQKEALVITRARNEYLHGSGVGFTGIPADAWWARYWAQATILVNALDTDLDDLVGSDRVGIVEAHLAQNAKNLEHRVEMLVERAKQRLAQYQSGVLASRLADEWNRPADLTAGYSHKVDEVCPACGNDGVLEGDDVQGKNIRYDQIAEDDFDAWAELSVGSDYFSCSTCRLTLDGYELLEAAGLPSTFETTGDASDYMEPEYGND